MDKKRLNISISMSRGLQDVARRAAFDDNRSLSSLVGALIKSYLQREGYIDQAGEPILTETSERPPLQTRLKLK